MEIRCRRYTQESLFILVHIIRHIDSIRPARMDLVRRGWSLVVKILMAIHICWILLAYQYVTIHVNRGQRVVAGAGLLVCLIWWNKPRYMVSRPLPCKQRLTKAILGHSIPVRDRRL